MNEKISKIIDIFDKYGFQLPNTNIYVKSKDEIMQEMMSTNLEEIADTLTEFGNCIKDIMIVVYDKE